MEDNGIASFDEKSFPNENQKMKSIRNSQVSKERGEKSWRR